MHIPEGVAEEQTAEQRRRRGVEQRRSSSLADSRQQADSRCWAVDGRTLGATLFSPPSSFSSSLSIWRAAGMGHAHVGGTGARASPFPRARIGPRSFSRVNIVRRRHAAPGNAIRGEGVADGTRHCERI